MHGTYNIKNKYEYIFRPASYTTDSALYFIFKQKIDPTLSVAMLNSQFKLRK